MLSLWNSHSTRRDALTKQKVMPLSDESSGRRVCKCCGNMEGKGFFLGRVGGITTEKDRESDA